jgi:hypothetical protein
VPERLAGRRGHIAPWIIGLVFRHVPEMLAVAAAKVVDGRQYAVVRDQTRVENRTLDM